MCDCSSAAVNNPKLVDSGQTVERNDRDGSHVHVRLNTPEIARQQVQSRRSVVFCLRP